MQSHHLAPSTKIMIVEDNEEDSFFLMRQLHQAQIDNEVTLFTGGHAARNHLLETSQRPLLVFLDLGLSDGVGGLELLSRIRQVSRLKTLPVIVMSGSLNPRDRQECEKLGVTAFLNKPVDLPTFFHSIAHLFPDRQFSQIAE
jgi:CheY-like chemotaxis protein